MSEAAVADRFANLQTAPAWLSCRTARTWAPALSLSHAVTSQTAVNLIRLRTALRSGTCFPCSIHMGIGALGIHFVETRHASLLWDQMRFKDAATRPMVSMVATSNLHRKITGVPCPTGQTLKFHMPCHIGISALFSDGEGSQLP